jgi:Flp pilus assembly protein TadG
MAGGAVTVLRRRTRSRGQALAELGIVLVLFVFLGLGIIEFGRAWMIINMATHAARDGARAAAALPASSRNAAGFVTNWGPIETAVEDEIQQNTGQTMNATGISNADTGGVPMLALRVQGNVNWLFFSVPLAFGPSFQFDRTVTFRDEGR